MVTPRCNCSDLIKPSVEYEKVGRRTNGFMFRTPSKLHLLPLKTRLRHKQSKTVFSFHSSIVPNEYNSVRCAFVDCCCSEVFHPMGCNFYRSSFALVSFSLKGYHCLERGPGKQNDAQKVVCRVHWPSFRASYRRNCRVFMQKLFQWLKTNLFSWVSEATCIFTVLRNYYPFLGKKAI
jgi:hypothetical protein